MNSLLTGSVFSLENPSAYKQWKSEKLHGYPLKLADLVVPIRGEIPVDEEIEQIKSLCAKANMAVYSFPRAHNNKEAIRRMGEMLGLITLDKNQGADDDGVSSITPKDGSRYIPYTNRAIGWHTDGYYNDTNHQVKGLILHCAVPAIEGGVNDLADHELAWMYLYDRNPDYIKVLMEEDAMSIPPETHESGLREESRGPVFTVDAEGHLHMRYTARSVNIRWKEGALMKDALNCLHEYLHSEHTGVFHVTMQSGQGLICNNVLHTRSSFTDSVSARRLMYRARYYERVRN